jgi:hypothetical protein
MQEPAPAPVKTPLTREAVSTAVQAAVRAAGGLEQVLSQVSSAFAGDSPARRGLQESLQAALRDLAYVNATAPESERAASLRGTVQSSSSELRTLEREIEGASRSKAHYLLMQALGGDPNAVKTLAVHASKVSPAFHNAIIAVAP